MVPALEESRRICGCVERVLQVADEVIVVDGGSRDGTCDQASTAGAHVLHSRPGRALQLNTGAAAATGDVIWFVHADARIPPGARDLFNIVSQQSTARPGCIIELEAIAEAKHVRPLVLKSLQEGKKMQDL